MVKVLGLLLVNPKQKENLKNLSLMTLTRTASMLKLYLEERTQWNTGIRHVMQIN